MNSIQDIHMGNMNEQVNYKHTYTGPKLKRKSEEIYEYILERRHCTLKVINNSFRQNVGVTRWGTKA